VGRRSLEGLEGSNHGRDSQKKVRIRKEGNFSSGCANLGVLRGRRDGGEGKKVPKKKGGQSSHCRKKRKIHVERNYHAAERSKQKV